MGSVPNPRVRLSAGAAGARLIKRVQPTCPVDISAASEVVLRVIVGRNGRVKSINLVSGHPMLVSAAIRAVSQWIYEPYTLQGRSVEVETTVSIAFHCPSVALAAPSVCVHVLDLLPSVRLEFPNSH